MSAESLDEFSREMMYKTIVYLQERLEKYEPGVKGFEKSEAFLAFVKNSPGLQHMVEGDTHLIAYFEPRFICPFCTLRYQHEEGKRRYNIQISGVDAAEVGKILSKVRQDIRQVNIEKKGPLGKVVGFIFKEGIVPTIVRISAATAAAYLLLRLGLRQAAIPLSNEGLEGYNR